MQIPPPPLAGGLAQRVPRRGRLPARAGHRRGRRQRPVRAARLGHGAENGRRDTPSAEIRRDSPRVAPPPRSNPPNPANLLQTSSTPPPPLLQTLSKPSPEACPILPAGAGRRAPLLLCDDARRPRRAETQPSGSRDTAERQPRDSRAAAERQPRGSRAAAEITRDSPTPRWRRGCAVGLLPVRMRRCEGCAGPLPYHRACVWRSVPDLACSEPAGNPASSTRRRRGYATRWCGDGVLPDVWFGSRREVTGRPCRCQVRRRHTL